MVMGKGLGPFLSSPHSPPFKENLSHPISIESGTCSFSPLHPVSFILYSSEKRDPSSFILRSSLPLSFSSGRVGTSRLALIPGNSAPAYRVDGHQPPCASQSCQEEPGWQRPPQNCLSNQYTALFPSLHLTAAFPFPPLPSVMLSPTCGSHPSSPPLSSPLPGVP